MNFRNGGQGLLFGKFIWVCRTLILAHFTPKCPDFLGELGGQILQDESRRTFKWNHNNNKSGLTELSLLLCQKPGKYYRKEMM